jgi:phosphatidylglycerophosphate synthase
MKNQNKFSIFSESEDSYYYNIRHFREQLLKPIAVFFAQLGFNANFFSAAGILMMLPFIFFFQYNPWISFLFLLLAIFCDNVDGSVARLKNEASEKGAFIDAVADYVVYFFVFFTLFYYSFFNAFWGALHLLNYVVMQFFVSLAAIKKVQVFPVLRSKLLIYLFLLIWLAWGINYFDPLLIFLTVYMLITNLFLFIKIKWSLS